MHDLVPAQIGNSMGVILPRDALARPDLERGDTLYLTDAPTAVG